MSQRAMFPIGPVTLKCNHAFLPPTIEFIRDTSTIKEKS